MAPRTTTIERTTVLPSPPPMVFAVVNSRDSTAAALIPVTVAIGLGVVGRQLIWSISSG
jgi:hypothetical protein